MTGSVSSAKRSEHNNDEAGKHQPRGRKRAYRGMCKLCAASETYALSRMHERGGAANCSLLIKHLRSLSALIFVVFFDYCLLV
jgi:hypothetical protein